MKKLQYEKPLVIELGSTGRWEASTGQYGCRFGLRGVTGCFSGFIGSSGV